MYKSIAEIPVGKTAQCGLWIVSKWGENDFDIQSAKKIKGSVFKDGTGAGSVAMGLTLEAAQQFLQGKV